MNIGASEILLLLFVVLVLFGGKRLPELARAIGKGLSEFRRATREVQREWSLPLTDISESHRENSLETKKPPEPLTDTLHDSTSSQSLISEIPPRSDS